MTLENLKKHHAHLKWLASGEFTERDFDYKIEATPNPNSDKKGEGGWSTMGDMEPERRQLIQGDAARTLLVFYSKHPEFDEKKIAEAKAKKIAEIKAEKEAKKKAGK